MYHRPSLGHRLADGMPASKNLGRLKTDRTTSTTTSSRIPSWTNQPRLTADMLARSTSRCCTKLRAPTSRLSLQVARPQCRQFSASSASHSTGPTNPSSAGLLAPFTSELDKIAPSFKINGSQVRVLQTPTEFYETLKVRQRWRRLVLSASGGGAD